MKMLCIVPNKLAANVSRQNEGGKGKEGHVKKWKVTFPIIGDFDSHNNFEVAGVLFLKDRTSEKWNAEMIIEAENRDEAIKEVQEKINEILDVISFVREVGFDLGDPHVHQEAPVILFQVVGSDSYPLFTKAYQKIIKKVYKNLEPNFRIEDKEIGKVMLALRWYRKGCFFSNPADKFLAFWIALESLAGEDSKSKRDLPFDVKDCKECVKKKVVENNNLRSDVISSIHKAYRPISVVIAEKIPDILEIGDPIRRILEIGDAGTEDIKIKIRKMQSDRSDMVHHGRHFQIDTLSSHSAYLQALIKSLLKEKLDMAFDNFINSWPTAELRRNSREDYSFSVEPIKQVLSKYPKGATIDDIKYGLFALTREDIREVDISARLEALIGMGDMGIRKINTEEPYFLITD
jgi:hypothetical protein